jgi:uncharacterized RDD family membrane protein YckC
VQAQGARVVTPEAVVLDVQTAGLGSRIFARAIDVAIQLGALIVVFLVLGVVASTASDGTLGTGGFVIVLIMLTIIIFGYPIIWESLWRGRTPGKAALGLRVVTSQGAPIRFRHALVRGLVGMVDVVALAPVGVISMLASTKDQRLGDVAAGTLVIRERAATRVSTPVVFYAPAGWESYVESLDVSAVTAAEYETVRAFLIRAYEMAPLPRSNLAARLAGPLAARWHQPIPAGMGPEQWLLCLACSYQRRHGAPAPWGQPPLAAGWGQAPLAAGWGQAPLAAGWGQPPLAAGWRPPHPATWRPPHPATRLDGPSAPTDAAAAAPGPPPTWDQEPTGGSRPPATGGFAQPD